MTREGDWETRRGSLLADLAAETVRLAEGRLGHVPTDMLYVEVVFHAGTKTLGGLSFSTALHALVEDVWLWPECGPRGGDLDLQDAERLELRGL